jgi:hypothetical protein
MSVLTKKYRSFARNGNWSDPLIDYELSTTYHFDNNAEEYDTVNESVSEIIDNNKYDIPPLPKTGTLVNVGELYTDDGKVYRVRQAHKVTIYDPDDIPALFYVYRKEATGDTPNEWIPGEKVDVGVIRLYNGKQWKCLQEHQTEKGWEPDKVAALWKEYTPPGGEIPVWVQPTGAHDAYNKGDKVHFPTANDPVYESLIDANVWSPATYPAGWKQL